MCRGIFGSIVISQINGLLVTKTCWLSIKSQSMKNTLMLFGIGTKILLVSSLAYCKPINIVLGTKNIHLTFCFLDIPFGIFTFCFDEAQKSLMHAKSGEN